MDTGHGHFYYSSEHTHAWKCSNKSDLCAMKASHLHHHESVTFNGKYWHESLSRRHKQSRRVDAMNKIIVKHRRQSHTSIADVTSTSAIYQYGTSWIRDNNFIISHPNIIYSTNGRGVGALEKLNFNFTRGKISRLCQYIVRVLHRCTFPLGINVW